MDLRLHIFAVVIGSIAGFSCATPRSYGDFLVHATAQDETALAGDAAEQLRRLYPPASTSLSIAAPDDAFGKALSARLRHLGFAVMDGDGSANAKNAMRLRYVVDDLGPQLFRTTLIVDRSRSTDTPGVLTARAYMRAPHGPAPAGAWTKQTR